MLRHYNYLFYKMYRFISNTNKSIPFWSTMIFISVLEFLNLASITLIMGLHENELILDNAGEIFISLIIILMILNYFVFLKDEKYIRILKDFQEDKRLFNKGGIIVFGYILASIFVFI